MARATGRGNSNVADVPPGQTVELLRYCLPDDAPEKVISAKATANLIDDTPPSVPYFRDLKAIVSWQGDRGGGTCELDCGRGTALTVIGQTLSISVRNDSPAPTPPDSPAINTYRVEVSAANYAAGHSRPYVSQRVDVPAGNGASALVRIPAYARDLLVYGNPPPPPGPPLPRVQFHPTNFAVPAVATALYLSPFNGFTEYPGPEIPVIAGSEYVLLENPDLAARRFVLVWHLNL